MEKEHTSTILYAVRKKRLQGLIVRVLSNQGERYLEQLEILNDLNDDYYLFSEDLLVTKETWKNKYHNFLSKMVRSPLYHKEIEALESELRKQDDDNLLNR